MQSFQCCASNVVPLADLHVWPKRVAVCARSCFHEEIHRSICSGADLQDCSTCPACSSIGAPRARAERQQHAGGVSEAAGRLSFALDLHWMCSSVDTACALAVSPGCTAARPRCAVRSAARSAATAVALAVSLNLVPYSTLGAASAGMLSIDGRCKTLDARANGHARSDNNNNRGGVRNASGPLGIDLPGHEGP